MMFLFLECSIYVLAYTFFKAMSNKNTKLNLITKFYILRQRTIHIIYYKAEGVPNSTNLLLCCIFLLSLLCFWLQCPYYTLLSFWKEKMKPVGLQ